MENVKLLAQKSEYLKDGEKKTATNFYLDCGNTRIPIEVKYFPSEDGKDAFYSSRKSVLTAFAEMLPDKTLKEN